MAPSAIVVPGSTVARVRERLVRTAERLARNGEVVILSGLDEAEHMRSIWRGPNVELVVEDTARSTVENAARTLPLLLERGVRDTVVVCAPAHLMRARWIFGRIYGSADVAVRFQVARVWPTPGALAWELAAGAVAGRQVRSQLRR